MTLSKREPKRISQRPKIGRRNILTAPSRPGYKRRYVLDTEGRIAMFIANGYTVVQESTPMGDANAGTASQVGATARKPAGSGRDYLLMEIPIELWEENQLDREADRQRAEAGILNDDPDHVSQHTYGEGVDIRRPRVTTN